MNEKPIKSNPEPVKQDGNSNEYLDETEAHLRRWGSGPVDPNAPIAAALAARVTQSIMDKYVRACDEKLAAILNPSERVKALLFWIERDKKDPIMYTDFVLDLIARGKIQSGDSRALRQVEVDSEFAGMTPEDMVREGYFTDRDMLIEALAFLDVLGLEEHFLNLLRNAISKSGVKKSGDSAQRLEAFEKEVAKTEARIASVHIRADELQATKDPRDLTGE